MDKVVDRPLCIDRKEVPQVEKQIKGGRARLAAVLTAIVLMLTGVGVFAAPEVVPFAPTMVHADVFDDFVTVDASGKVTAGASSTAPDMGGLVTQYKTIATVITSILTITMLIFMLIQFTKLGAAGDNEMARKKAIAGILTTGIATALLGGATIVVGFFWNVISNTQKT